MASIARAQCSRGRPERWDTTQGAGPYIRARWVRGRQQRQRAVARGGAILRLCPPALHVMWFLPAASRWHREGAALVGAANGLHKASAKPPGRKVSARADHLVPRRGHRGWRLLWPTACGVVLRCYGRPRAPPAQLLVPARAGVGLRLRCALLPILALSRTGALSLLRLSPATRPSPMPPSSAQRPASSVQRPALAAPPVAAARPASGRRSAELPPAALFLSPQHAAPNRPPTDTAPSRCNISETKGWTPPPSRSGGTHTTRGLRSPPASATLGQRARRSRRIGLEWPIVKTTCQRPPLCCSVGAAPTSKAPRSDAGKHDARRRPGPSMLGPSAG